MSGFWNFVSALDAAIHVIIPKFRAHLFKLVSHSRQLVLRTKLYIQVNLHIKHHSKKMTGSGQHLATCNPQRNVVAFCWKYQPANQLYRKMSVSFTFAPPYLNIPEVWTCGYYLALHLPPTIIHTSGWVFCFLSKNTSKPKSQLINQSFSLMMVWWEKNIPEKGGFKKKCYLLCRKEQPDCQSSTPTKHWCYLYGLSFLTPQGYERHHCF